MSRDKVRDMKGVRVNEDSVVYWSFREELPRPHVDEGGVPQKLIEAGAQ